MEEKIRTLGSLSALHFTVQLDDVRLRTGKRTQRIKIDHPVAAAIIPFVDPEHILMVRQWRYALGCETLEIPAGKVDPGEDILEGAKRELREETGYEADSFVELVDYYPAIGYSNEIIRIYMASGLRLVSNARDEDEISELETLPLTEVYSRITRNEIQDGKTVIGISLFLAKQGRGEIPERIF